MMFRDYLQQQDYSAATIQTYEKYLLVFTNWLETEMLHPDAVFYAELLGFMRAQETAGRSRDTINMLLCVVRHYFAYRIATRQGGHNPAAGVYIKGIARKLPSGLLSVEQLQELYDLYRVQLNASLEKRVLLGLMIYQGLTVREIRRLEVTDVRIREGMINIRGGRCYNGRRLKLDAAQVKYLDLHLQQTASPAMRQQRLINVGHISYQVQQLFKTLKKLYPAVINIKQIRSSVITEWLHHYHLRQVQYMAGHKYASSTQRYQITHLEDLQTQLQQHHPIEMGIYTNGDLPTA